MKPNQLCLKVKNENLGVWSDVQSPRAHHLYIQGLPFHFMMWNLFHKHDQFWRKCICELSSANLRQRVDSAIPYLHGDVGLHTCTWRGTWNHVVWNIAQAYIAQSQLRQSWLCFSHASWSSPDYGGASPSSLAWDHAHVVLLWVVFTSFRPTQCSVGSHEWHGTAGNVFLGICFCTNKNNSECCMHDFC